VAWFVGWWLAGVGVGGSCIWKDDGCFLNCVFSEEVCSGHDDDEPTVLSIYHSFAKKNSI